MGVFSSPIMAGLAKIALVVVGVGGLTVGAVFAYQTTRGDDDKRVAGQLEVTGSPTLAATATPPGPPPSIQQPTATTLPPTQPPPPTDAPPTSTPDTRVAIRDLPTADQIQLGKDDKYFIADRGDGCIWVEQGRYDAADGGEVVVLHTDCPADFAFTFRPQSGSFGVLVP